MKRMAFIATREPSYSRVSITRRELKKKYELDEYLCQSSSYPLRMLWITIQLLWSWVSGRLRKADVVFVGFLAQPIFPLVRLLYRGPIVADAYFSLYDAMVNDKQKVSAGSLTGRICHWLDRQMLKRSELCFTDTQQHVQYMRQFFDVPNANLKRLWISAESEPLENNAAYQTGDRFEVFFWGGFIPLQGVDTIVRSAAILKNENIHFTIFGSGQTFDACQELATELSGDNLNFAGWQLADQIPRQAAKSHVALGIFGDTEKALRVIPNKSYEALAMGIPLISCRSAAANELLEEDKHCMLVDAKDPVQLAEKIKWARDNYPQTLEMAHQGLQLFDSTCSPAKTAAIMYEAIDQLLRTHQTASVDELLGDGNTLDNTNEKTINRTDQKANPDSIQPDLR